jgi:hypothetical protein
LVPAEVDDLVLAAAYLADQQADAAAETDGPPREETIRLPRAWQQYLTEQDETCDLALRRTYDRAALATQHNGRVRVGPPAADTDGPIGGGPP